MRFITLVGWKQYAPHKRLLMERAIHKKTLKTYQSQGEISVQSRNKPKSNSNMAKAQLSPRLASIIPKPQPTPPRKTRRNLLQAYISSKDSAHKQYQKRWHRKYVQGTHRRDSCMKGLGSARRRSWGSLPTHLQEV